MSWFSRNELADKVSALEQENTSLRADLEAAQAGENQVPALTQEVAGLKEDLQSVRDALAAEETAHAATRQELADASEQLQPEFLAKRITASANSEDEADAPVKNAIESEVTNRIVAAGHKPIDTLKAEREEETTSSKMGLEAFNNLSAVEKNKFIRDGGRLTK